MRGQAFLNQFKYAEVRIPDVPRSAIIDLLAFSDNGTLLRGEKHEDGGVFGLLVQGANRLHR
jgi:hypothetical protein